MELKIIADKVSSKNKEISPLRPGMRGPAVDMTEHLLWERAAIQNTNHTALSLTPPVHNDYPRPDTSVLIPDHQLQSNKMVVLSNPHIWSLI